MHKGKKQDPITRLRLRVILLEKQLIAMDGQMRILMPAVEKINEALKALVVRNN